MSWLDSMHLFLMRKGQRYIPGTPWNTIYRDVNKHSQNILDVGCGDGVAIGMLYKILRNNMCYTGVDIYQASLDAACDKAGQLNVSSEFILCDIHQLALERKTFDIVLCLEVVEHLEKEDGKVLIKKLDEIARKQIIMSLPVGKFDQDRVDEKDNPFMKHKSAWTPGEFRKNGFKVRGYGLPIYGGSNGSIANLPKPLVFLRQGIWIGTTIFTYFIPEKAGWMICVKNIDKK